MLLKKLYTAYAFVVFALLFLLFFPLLLIPMFFSRQFQLTGKINRWWAKSLFFLTFLPYRVETRAPLDARKQYIFCPNHFSYLDIPTMGLNPVNAIFVGKSEMENIPLFGFMYRRLHITVNRASLRSKFNTLIRSLEALDAGKSLVIFPEGGIFAQHPPAMSRFKEGAFRAAIEKQIPIVPVTIPSNWIILPDTGELLLHRGRIDVIFHEPVETTGMTGNEVEFLSHKIFGIIETELQKHENRRSHT
jgi:1-acyl-sn-glycerol-3-phosphate acyltransferase